MDTQLFDPYTPPQAEVHKVRTLTTRQDWVYPLSLHAAPGWLVKLHVEIRDALQRVVVGGTWRLRLWELFGYRLRRDPSLDLPTIQIRPDRLYAQTKLVVFDGGDEVARISSPVSAPWVAEAPGGIRIEIRYTNPLTRWRAKRSGARAWPPVAKVGQQLSALQRPGYPILTVHAGRTLPPFLVVRRSFEGVLQSARVERLEGEVPPEAEWLALQTLVGFYLSRVPGFGLGG